MGVCIANSHAKNALALDHEHHGFVGCHQRLMLACEVGKHIVAVNETAQRQLTDDSRMAQQGIAFDDPTQLRICTPEVVDLDRGVGEDHADGALRRLGAASASGMLPPRAINRLPASTRMSVSNACRTRGTVSLMPDSERAVSSRLSSISIVDRIAPLLCRHHDSTTRWLNPRAAPMARSCPYRPAMPQRLRRRPRLPRALGMGQPPEQ